MANENLSRATKNKKDEFYTQLEDIEKELRFYKGHFKNKVVLCNCDDPFESNFFKYFALNFNALKLKKLICTCYDNSPVLGTQLSLFDVKGITISKKQTKKAYKIVITKIDDENNDGAIDLLDIKQLIKNKGNVLTLLKGDGDFRSEECIDILKTVDIIVTNPPFSLFREYIAQLMKYKKSFLIIGNQNAITYKEIFPYIKNNMMWLGISMNGSNRYFQVPDDYPLTESTGKIVNNKKFAFVKSVVWFTNMEHQHRNDKIILYKKYSDNEYPKYDNYDAINVNKVNEIPNDYYGCIGVPITFLHKYNPEQFSIIGLLQSSNEEQAGIPILREYDDFEEMRQDMTYTGAKGSKANGNPVLPGKSEKGNFLYNRKTKEYVHSAYARILIKRR